jgi:hypothetical protein
MIDTGKRFERDINFKRGGNVPDRYDAGPPLKIAI